MFFETCWLVFPSWLFSSPLNILGFLPSFLLEWQFSLFRKCVISTYPLVSTSRWCSGDWRGGGPCISVTVTLCPGALGGGFQDYPYSPSTDFHSGNFQPRGDRRSKGTKHLGGSSLLKETLPLPGDTFWGRRKRKRRREKPLSG